MFSAQNVKELREKTGAGMMDCKKALEATNGNMEEAIDWLREKGISKAAKKESRIAAEGLANVLVSGNKAVILEVNSETDFVAKNKEFTDFIKTISEALVNSNAKTMEEALEVKVEDKTINEILVALIAKIGEKISFRRFEIIEKNDDQVFGSYMHMGGKIAVLTLLDGNNEEVAKDIAMHACAMRPTYTFVSEVPSDVIEKEREIYKEQAINEGKNPEIAEKMVEGRVKKYYKEVCLTEQAFIKEPGISVSKYASDNNCNIVKMVRYEVGEGIEKRNENFAEEVANQING